MNAPIDWLLESPPFVEYRTRRDLLDTAEENAEVALARQRMLASAPVRGLIQELAGWPGKATST